MANPSVHTCLMQLRYHGVADSKCRTYQSAYTSFCFRFNINPLPATTLTLQYFCADKSQSISYQTLKVYLATICLMYIEHGLPDPTIDQTLLLVCRGIRRHQKVIERRRLPPITIDILKSLKSYLYLRLSSYTLCKQRMLWSLSFYGFLRVSKCLSLTWSDIKRTGNHLVIELHQSRTDPLQ